MKAIKIWGENPQEKDTYLDFKGIFKSEVGSKAILKISCDSIFSVYLNGELVGFGNCSNFIDRKLFYTFDLSKLIKRDNELLITVWHQGVGTQTYINQDAYLMFVVESNDNVLLESNKNILFRKNPNYEQGKCKLITKQLGLSFSYKCEEEQTEYKNVIEYGEDISVETGVSNLKLKGRANAKIAPLGNGYLIDLGKETVGYLDLDIDSEINHKATISYGEHLVDGKVPQIIGERDFSFEIEFKKGNNKCSNYFRRLACRYIYINSKDIKINYLGLNVVEYPTKDKPKPQFNDAVLNQIYDTCLYTLKCCMHEHYEDCPWREQALYAFDSRNQMLCGYYAFEGHEFQRANLLLLAQSLRDDGLLSICAPAESDLSIPFFSLIYPVQVYEYISHTGDREILNEVGETLKKIMSVFDKMVEENNLIADFPHPHWNFYEWTEGSDNSEQIDEPATAKRSKKYSLILNCMYVYAYSYFDKIFSKKTDLEKTKQAIQKQFFNETTNTYNLYSDNNASSVLGNSLAILIGLGNKELGEKLKLGSELIPVSLSTAIFFYDALLSLGNNEEWILNDIRNKYNKMLENGATTFWETEKGFQDFDGAGSLCHGWSAIPVYYFNKII